MQDRLFIVPRWSGRPADDWYIWFAAQVEASTDRYHEIHIAHMPDPDQPTIPAWTAALDALVTGTPEQLTHTVLVGHSVGCQAILRYLAALPEGQSVGGVFGVGGWWRVDDPFEGLWPWMATPLDDARVRQAAGQVVVLLSTNDPFTADYEESRQQWTERLGATVELVERAGHFNKTPNPPVLSTFLKYFG